MSNYGVPGWEQMGWGDPTGPSASFGPSLWGDEGDTSNSKPSEWAKRRRFTKDGRLVNKVVRRGIR